MDALSPAKACDPWAVYTAKSMSSTGAALTDMQEKILRAVREADGMEPEALADRLNLTSTDLQREIATLRHMEKIRARMKDGKKVICLW
jgi:predicted HTH transcriptional regulator